MTIDFNNRHEIGKHTLIVNNRADFEIWQKKSLLEQHGIHAIAYKHEYSLEQLHQCAQEIAQMIRESKEPPRGFFETFKKLMEPRQPHPNGIQYNFSHDKPANINNTIFSTLTKKLLNDLVSIFCMVGGISENPKEKHSLLALLNSHNPPKIHKHGSDDNSPAESTHSGPDPFITMTLSGAGTIIDSGEVTQQIYNNPIGELFEMSAGWVCVGDGQLGHRAPQKEDEGVITANYDDTVDRVNILLG